MSGTKTCEPWCASKATVHAGECRRETPEAAFKARVAALLGRLELALLTTFAKCPECLGPGPEARFAHVPGCAIAAIMEECGS